MIYLNIEIVDHLLFGETSLRIGLAASDAWKVETQ
jgi:hypothetical protein